MDSSVIQSIFSFMTNNIFIIIYLFAIIEVILVVLIFILMRSHEMILLDVSDNLLKGFKDAPDKDSSQSVHDKIQSALDFINEKISTNHKFKAEFAKNANMVTRRSFYDRHYKIEIFASVMSTIVQVFPLLGILGTILAIAQTALSGTETIDVATLSSAFVLGMNTTILGITLSIIFMIIESTFQPKIERIISESYYYKQIVSRINLSTNELSQEND